MHVTGTPEVRSLGTVPARYVRFPNRLYLFPAWLACVRLTTFPQHPFPDVRRAVDHRNPVRFTAIKKANGFDIDEVQFLQIQNHWCVAKLDFGFDLIQVLSPKIAAQSNPRSGPINLERHENRGSPVHTMRMQGRLHSEAIENTWLSIAGHARF
jgi:hypothetical protein